MVYGKYHHLCEVYASISYIRISSSQPLILPMHLSNIRSINSIAILPWNVLSWSMASKKMKINYRTSTESAAMERRLEKLLNFDISEHMSTYWRCQFGKHFVKELLNRCIFDTCFTCQFAYMNISTTFFSYCSIYHKNPDSKVHGANMGPIWGRQDPGGPHVRPMNFAIMELTVST